MLYLSRIKDILFQDIKVNGLIYFFVIYLKFKINY